MVNLTYLTGDWDPGTGTLPFPSPNYIDPRGQYAYAFTHSSIRALIAVLGIFFNGFLVAITARNKQLRNTCGFLLAAVAVSDAVAGMNGLLTLGFTVNGFVGGHPAPNMYVDPELCLWVNTPSVVAFVASFVLMLAIALDRLASVLLPLRYNSVPVTPYISGIVLVAVGIGVGLFILAFNYLDQTIPFLCSLDNIFFGDYGTLINEICLYFNAATVATYGGIYVALRFNHSSAVESTRRILRSLVTIVAVVVVCWMLVVLERLNQIYIFPYPTAMAFITWSAIGALLALAQAVINPTILYFTSHTYREVILFELRKLRAFLCCREQPVVQPSWKTTMAAGQTRVNNNNSGMNNNNKIQQQTIVQPKAVIASKKPLPMIA